MRGCVSPCRGPAPIHFYVPKRDDGESCPQTLGMAIEGLGIIDLRKIFEVDADRENGIEEVYCAYDGDVCVDNSGCGR